MTAFNLQLVDKVGAHSTPRSSLEECVARFVDYLCWILTVIVSRSLLKSPRPLDDENLELKKWVCSPPLNFLANLNFFEDHLFLQASADEYQAALAQREMRQAQQRIEKVRYASISDLSPLSELLFRLLTYCSASKLQYRKRRH